MLQSYCCQCRGLFFCFKQKTAYEMRISDWSSDVCSSDLTLDMGRVYEGIDEKLTTWLQAQPLFVVATAPLSADGLVNCSPKGGVGSFVVLTSTRVAYLDLTGRSEERRVGKECVSTCRSRWWPYH